MKRILLIALFAPLAALAQDAPINYTIQSPVVAKMIGPDRTMLTAPVAGAPYSAEEVTTFTQTLGDGTHIQREDKVTVYRDGQGRLRRESPTEITISDPVADVGYTLDPNKLTARKNTVMRVMFTQAAADYEAKVAVATKNPINAPGSADSANGPIYYFKAGPEVANANRQSLGTQTIEGLVSQGTGSTETIPAGSIGNDRDIQVVDERWYSPELKTTTMTKHSDPRTGEEVFRLTNIRRGDPSPDLFQLPAGYQLVDAGIQVKKRE